MPKGVQRSNKESKKPKKDDQTPKPLAPVAGNPAITTAVIERGKKKTAK